MNERPSLLEIYDILLDACCGVRDLHRNDFAHRDLKPENFLLFTTPADYPRKNGRKFTKIVKVGDLGCVDSLDNQFDKNRRTGTVGFMAPELFVPLDDTCGEVLYKADVYALGVIACCLLSWIDWTALVVDEKKRRQAQYGNACAPLCMPSV